MSNIEDCITSGVRLIHDTEETATERLESLLRYGMETLPADVAIIGQLRRETVWVENSLRSHPTASPLPRFSMRAMFEKLPEKSVHGEVDLRIQEELGFKGFLASALLPSEKPARILVFGRCDQCFDQSLIPWMDALALGAETLMTRALLEETRKDLEVARQELSGILSKDPLTGLMNDSGIVELADRLSLRIRGGSEVASILLITLDRLRLLRETYGREAVDAYLKKTSGVLRRSIRPTDFAAHITGGEFVVLLPETTAARATFVAERIRRRFSEDRLTTLSIGVDELTGRDRPFAQTLQLIRNRIRQKAPLGNQVVSPHQVLLRTEDYLNPSESNTASP